MSYPGYFCDRCLFSAVLTFYKFIKPEFSADFSGKMAVKKLIWHDVGWNERDVGVCRGTDGRRG